MIILIKAKNISAILRNNEYKKQKEFQCKITDNINYKNELFNYMLFVLLKLFLGFLIQ